MANLPPIRPNAGIQARYETDLQKLIAEMNASIKWFLLAAYKRNTPLIAQDANPAAELRDAVKKLRRRWTAKFKELAPKLAAAFVGRSSSHVDAVMLKLLRDAGFTVRFRMSRTLSDVMAAKVTENVGLIKSIPERHFDQIEGMVMRSIQTGRNVGELTKDLQDAFGVTRRRAALIARDQTNKANADVQRARALDLDIYEATWLHSGGGRHPRPSHVAASGKTFDLRKGMLIDREYIQPGEKINCRCVWRLKLPSLQKNK